MRTLIYVPIIHSSADMGSLQKNLRIKVFLNWEKMYGKSTPIL